MKLVLLFSILILPVEALAAPGYVFEKVVRVGDPAPGTGETFEMLSPQSIEDATGRVYFWGGFGDPLVPGLFSWANGTVRPEVLPGDAAPASIGGVYTGAGEVSLDASGAMVFVARIDDGQGERIGLVLRDGSGDRVVVLQGDAMPGLPGLTFDVFWRVEIDALGRVVFEAYDDISAPTAMMIARWDDGTIDAIATTGDPVPLPGAGVIDSLSVSQMLESMSSDAGETVFEAYVLPAAESRLLLGTPGGVIDLLGAGDTLPAVGGGGVTIDSLGFPFGQTGAGDTMFVWYDEQPDGEGGTKLLNHIAKLVDGVVHPVVAEEDPVPGQPGRVFDNVQLAGSSRAGDVGFFAETHGFPTQELGFFVASPSGTIREVCRVGEPGVGAGISVEFCAPVVISTFGPVVLQVLEQPGSVEAIYLARPAVLAAPATRWPGIAVLVAVMIALAYRLQPALRRAA